MNTLGQTSSPPEGCLRQPPHRRGANVNALACIERYLKAKPKLGIDTINARDECALQSSLVPAYCIMHVPLLAPGTGHNTLLGGPGETSESPSVGTDR